MKIIYFSFTLFISFISFGQTSFENWKYDNDNTHYMLINDNGIEVENCKSIPQLVVAVRKPQGEMSVILYNKIYPNYKGGDIDVKLMFRTKGGSFVSGIKDVKMQEFNSEMWMGEDSVLYLKLKTKHENQRVSHLITGYFPLNDFNDDINQDYESVYFQTIYNEEKKVFRFPLDDYMGAFQLLRKEIEKNINPFEN